MTGMSLQLPKNIQLIKKPNQQMKKYTLSFLLIFFASTFIVAQISEYNFDNNITDQTSLEEATYLINGLSSPDAPTYLNDPSVIQISLDPTQGLEFPTSLINAVDFSQSLEIGFTFTITDIGEGPGIKDLWNCQVQANEPGFTIYIRHDEFSNEDDFDIIFSYADGGFNQGVPDHPGHDQITIGSHFVGDVIDVRLILDFENRTWTSIVNGNYNSLTINDYYDWDLLLQSLQNNDWNFGWHNGQEDDVIFDPNTWTSSLSLDELTFYSPRQAGDTDIIITALQAMTAHVDGSNTLTLDQRNAYLNELYLNYFNNHNLVSTEVFEYLNAYEANYPPVYLDRNQVLITNLLPESQLLIFLQQSIFDNEYILDNVNDLVGVVYEFSEVFPGPVAATAVRVDDATVEINGTHTYDPAARVVSDLDDAKRPTGYYAAPGEVITIEIPNSLVDQGLSVTIGAHDKDHSSLTVTNRFNRISKTYNLSTASTDIISPFGGGIYINVPIDSQLDWFDLTISGAVKSPYFSWRNGRETDPDVWALELAGHEVEWVDLESDKYMMTLPLAHVGSLTDPTSLMTQWDDIMDGYRYVGGRTTPRPRTEYFAIDSRLPSNGFGTGYPQVIGDNSAPFAPFNSSDLYPTQVLNSDFWDSGLHITFHEMGHAVMHPTLVDEVETIVHVPTVYIYNVLYGLSIDDAFRFSSDENFTLNEAAIDWMITFNFRNNNDMGCDPTMDELVCDELRYQHRGYAKYIDMAKHLGWETVHNMNNVFYDTWTTGGVGSLDVTKNNVLEAAAESNGVNVSPLFHFWGLAPSSSLQAQLEVLPQSSEIYNQLIAYYNIIPGTQAEFLPWRDILLNSKDPVHHDRINDVYNNYESENYAEQMQDQICSIIELYFPDSTFCSAPTSNTNLELNDDFILLNPNPTNGIFTIDGDFQNCSIQILSENGTIHSDLKKQNSPLKIDISHLPAGLYFIKISKDDDSYLRIKQIIKTN